jgi:glycosyltransferase involved in cell wall biosynthesis
LISNDSVPFFQERFNRNDYKSNEVLVKIGVDVRQLSRPLTGMGRYTLEVCQALSKMEGVSLYLYSPAPLRIDFQGLERAQVRTKNWDSGVMRQLWMETFLPAWTSRDNLDVFWGPAHRIPRLLPPQIARVITIHDLAWKYAGDTMPPLRRKLEQIQIPSAIRNSDWVVTDALSTASALKQEYPESKNKTSVIHLGATHYSETLPLENLADLGITKNYFLFVGTLEPRKNLFRLLNSYAKLCESVKDKAHFVIVGGKGWCGVDIEKTICNLGLEPYVHVLGYVDNITLSSLYRHALFLAMPSLYEGFGLPLVEAMAHGTPVLTSNNSSMPEVAGDAGLLVNPLSVESIRDGLKKLILDDNFRTILASRAKDSVKQFDWDISASKLVDVFRRAIELRRKK